MREKDVPQEQGIAEGLQEVCYAVDEQGRYVLAASRGWEPKNIANGQAWELLCDQLEEARQQVLAGKRSPLAFHMVKNLMDIRLLSQYTGFYVWQIRRHLKPTVFKGLKLKTLTRYAVLFKMSVPELLDMELVRRCTFQNVAGEDDAA